MQYQVVHRISGRIRIRLQALRNDRVFADCIYAVLKSQAGVNRLRVSQDSCSITVFYDESVFVPETFFEKTTESTVLKADLPFLGKDPRKRLRKTFLYRLAYKLELAPLLQLLLGATALTATLFAVPQRLKKLLICAATLPIFGRGLRTAYEERRPAVEFLDAASIIVLTVKASYFPASVMLLLISFGEFLRDFAARKSEEITEELLGLSQHSAWLVSGDSRRRIAANKVNPGELVVAYTGEQVPVDGIIESGQATVIKAGATFDALPNELGPGDDISQESVVLDGKLYIRSKARRLPAAHDPFMERVMERERRRLLYRSSYQRNALKKGYNVVTPILLFAASVFLLSRNLSQALTIICFDLVTGVRIALPTALLAYMHRAGQQGILVKTAKALEKLSAIDVIVFSRTGVVTAGDSELTEVISIQENYKKGDILKAAAAVEYRYHHPAARAIYRYAKTNGLEIQERKNSELFAGLGVQAEVSATLVCVGSKRLMMQKGISVENAADADKYMKARGDSVAYVAFGNTLVGLISYRDKLRAGAESAVRELKKNRKLQLLLTSGDSVESVQRTADSLGVKTVFARLSPEEKADLLRDYQLRGLKVALIGDDVSDALAMAQADLAIAMNDSTDLARYRADIIFTDDDLNKLPFLLELSKQAMNHLRQTMLFVSLPNWLGLLLSVSNKVGPVGGTVLNNGSVLLAALNGLRPALSARTELHLHETPPET